VVLQALPSGQPHAQLTELTGLKGAIGQRSIVMGIISSSEEGGTCIEDEGALVPLDLSSARTTGGLITGGCDAVCNGAAVVAGGVGGAPGPEQCTHHWQADHRCV
jgi:hypothetical protein